LVLLAVGISLLAIGWGTCFRYGLERQCYILALIPGMLVINFGLNYLRLGSLLGRRRIWEKPLPFYFTGSETDERQLWSGLIASCRMITSVVPIMIAYVAFLVGSVWLLESLRRTEPVSQLAIFLTWWGLLLGTTQLLTFVFFNRLAAFLLVVQYLMQSIVVTMVLGLAIHNSSAQDILFITDFSWAFISIAVVIFWYIIRRSWKIRCGHHPDESSTNIERWVPQFSMLESLGAMLVVALYSLLIAALLR